MSIHMHRSCGEELGWVLCGGDTIIVGVRVV